LKNEYKVGLGIVRSPTKDCKTCVWILHVPKLVHCTMLDLMLRYLTTQRCIKTFLFIATILSNYKFTTDAMKLLLNRKEP
jgi:hypothetical protein